MPTILEDLWLPGNAFKGLSAEQMAGYHGPTYAMFEVEFGVRMVRAEEKIRAVAADAAQAALLQVQPHSPLLSVERIAYTYNDVPMELRRGLYRTDTHHYRNELELIGRRKPVAGETAWCVAIEFWVRPTNKAHAPMKATP